MSDDNACGITVTDDIACLSEAGKALSHPPSESLIDMCIGSGVCWVTRDHRLECSGSDETQSGMARVFCGFGLRCGLTIAGDLSCSGQYAPVTTAKGPFTEVAVGLDHVCALRTDKTIKCFGSDGASRAPAGAFRAIAAAPGHTCGISVDGSMRCWGATDQALPGKLVAISAGILFDCAIDENGHVSCTWSVNPPTTGGFTQVSVSQVHACGLSNGLATCWGLGGSSKLRPRQPPDGLFTSIHVDDDSSCGLRPDGTLVCWGSLEWPDEPRPKH
jgi:Regulator of Chromosome Condensation (RCC1) repeat protein